MREAYHYSHMRLNAGAPEGKFFAVGIMGMGIGRMASKVQKQLWMTIQYSLTTFIAILVHFPALAWLVSIDLPIACSSCDNHWPSNHCWLQSHHQSSSGTVAFTLQQHWEIGSQLVSYELSSHIFFDSEAFEIGFSIHIRPCTPPLRLLGTCGSNLSEELTWCWRLTHRNAYTRI